MNRLISIMSIALMLISCIPSTPRGNAQGRVISSEKKTSKNPVTHLELPAFRDGSRVVYHTGYTSCFNSVNMIPDWVAYELTSEELLGDVKRPKNSPFQPDPNYRGAQPQRSDYSYSGWDKGHMAPCADMKWSIDAMLESFYFTNVCPQNKEFNAGDWQNLEEKVREIAREKGNVYIVCGPIVGNNVFGKIGANSVVIPDAFFKAMLYSDSVGFHSIAFVMPNSGEHHPLSFYAKTVNYVEEITGLNLFFRMNDKIEENVESQLNLMDWMIR